MKGSDVGSCTETKFVTLDLLSVWKGREHFFSRVSLVFHNLSRIIFWNHVKWHLLMTCHCPDLGSVSEWLRLISCDQSEALQRSGLWHVKKYGISAQVSQTSIVSLCNRTVVERRMNKHFNFNMVHNYRPTALSLMALDGNIMWQAWQKFCLKTFPQYFTFLSQVFL